MGCGWRLKGTKGWLGRHQADPCWFRQGHTAICTRQKEPTGSLPVAGLVLSSGETDAKKWGEATLR